MQELADIVQAESEVGVFSPQNFFSRFHVALLEQFLEKRGAVFRPELRKNKYLERVSGSIKS